MRIWFNGQPKKDWTQNRYNLFLEVNTSLKRKENITYCGVRIRTTAPLWCEWTRWEEKEKEKRKYLARNALGSTKRPFKNFLLTEPFCWEHKLLLVCVDKVDDFSQQTVIKRTLWCPPTMQIHFHSILIFWHRINGFAHFLRIFLGLYCICLILFNFGAFTIIFYVLEEIIGKIIESCLIRPAV